MANKLVEMLPFEVRTDNRPGFFDIRTDATVYHIGKGRRRRRRRVGSITRVQVFVFGQWNTAVVVVVVVVVVVIVIFLLLFFSGSISIVFGFTNKFRHLE